MQKTGWVKVGSALLRQQILELRLTGMTVRDIARTVHRGPTRVHQILTSALAELAATNAETTDQIVKLELERLDKMVEAMWPMRADHDTSTALLRVMERRARLLGLDKPSQSEIGGFGGTPLAPPVINIGFANGGPGKPSDGGAGAKGP